MSPTSLSRCSWQRQKCRTGREQPPLFPDSAHNHSLLTFCKTPFSFSAGIPGLCRGCSSATRPLLMGGKKEFQAWNEHLGQQRNRAAPELTFPQTPTPVHPNPTPLSVCGCCLSVLPLQSTWLFKTHFNFINPYHDSTSRCRLCA